MSKINTFFLRVAARCNLSCDYCYVFRHRDKSWMNYPAQMCLTTVQKFAARLKEYVDKSDLTEINVVFHGGEPLVLGGKRIIEYTDLICATVGEKARVSFSMQTNGTLITQDFLDCCLMRNIGISVSIDGPKAIHDKHRCYASGGGSFSTVLNNIHLLQKYGSIFDGVIGVIDPMFSPEDVLNFFDEMDLLDVDLLLPDSTYQDPPLGRDENSSLYTDWLCAAFDCWFKTHQRLHFRTFEYILKGILGLDTDLDAFGLGELDYLTIEADGSYHTSDILKVAYENASAIGGTLDDMSICEALNSPKISEYNELLSWNSLPDKCKICEYGYICGGGSLPHRYSPDTGFQNPTVYCQEMYSLIAHAKASILQELKEEAIK